MNQKKPSTSYSMLTDDFLNLELRMLGLAEPVATETAGRMNAVVDDLLAEILPPGMSRMFRDLGMWDLPPYVNPFQKHLAKRRGPCKMRKAKKQFNMRYGV